MRIKQRRFMGTKCVFHPAQGAEGTYWAQPEPIDGLRNFIFQWLKPAV